MELRVFGDEVIFRVGGLPITDTMLTSAAVSLGLLAAAGVLSWFVRHRPRQVAGVLAAVTVNAFDRLTRDILGHPNERLSNFAGALFIFIAACNVAGMLPLLHPATGSLATTAALAVVVFLSVPAAGVVSQGPVGYLKHYFRPNPLLFPLHVMSEISRTVALALRLFGNIMSGHLIVALLIALVGFPLPVPFMALDLLIGLLQAYIFTILATVYIAAALGGEEQA